MIQKRIIVTIIGSSRKKKFMFGIAQTETLKGKIVIAPGFYHHADDSMPISDAKKRELDDLMLDKIELADEIIICNHNGYIGQSTREGIAHAKKLRKPIKRWFDEPDAPPPMEPSRP
jgi:hypothetical protein